MKRYLADLGGVEEHRSHSCLKQTTCLVYTMGVIDVLPLIDSKTESNVNEPANA